MNCSAHVSLSQPFARLKAANVSGALTAAQLAIDARAPLVFVSSIGALPPRILRPADSASAAEEGRGDGWRPLDRAELGAKSGYGASKAVAEALLFAAAGRAGLDLRVVRPGAVSGHTTSGLSNPRDATILLLSAMVQLGAAPDRASLPLRWIPVDFVAAAVIRLAFAPSVEASGCAFNLFSAGPPISVAVDALREAGYALRAVPASAWPAELARLPTSHRAAPLVGAFARMDVGHDVASGSGSESGGAAAAQSAAEAALPVHCARAVLHSLGLPWPAPVGAKEVGRAVQWLVVHGYLSAVRSG